MALVSPGVEVNVIDESFYTPAAAGTVPMIFVATAQNKNSSSGAGIAAGTTKANAGKPYLITSQRELGETFGDPLFYSDANGNMIHGGELNEYGLQTAYSLLGVSNRAYVVRADLDLGKLGAKVTAPGGEPANGAYWADTQVTSFGILEWNAASVTTTGGQSFSVVPRTVIVEASDMDSGTDAPKTSIGQIGDYAIDGTIASGATNTNFRVYYKTPANSSAAGTAGDWVRVGTTQWSASWPVVRGTATPVSISLGDTLTINTLEVTASGTDITTLAADINSRGITGVTAAVVDSALELYSTGVDVVVENGSGALVGDANTDSDNGGALGIITGTYAAPKVTIAPHTLPPAYKDSGASEAPTGSIWVKTTEPNGGAKFSVKSYNTDTQLWQSVAAPMYASPEGALFGLDKSGGGANLLAGDLYVKANDSETSPVLADFRIYSRAVAGATIATGDKIATQMSVGAKSFALEETTAGSLTRTRKTITTAALLGASTDADKIAAAINGAGFTNIVALVDASNKVVIQHKTGGEIRITDTDGALVAAGFVATGNSAKANVYTAPSGDAVNDLVISNWKPLVATASDDAPASLTADGELWYSSVVDEADIMVHDGANGWQGYLTVYPNSNATGPIVSATEPTKQTDSVTDLVDGDLWVSTADVEAYGTIYRYNSTLAKWILIDKSDQTSENGILFSDARWSDAGSNSAQADIIDLLSSDYLDPDAPDAALYPEGMLLWNTRRSGFNVKRFERNYIDTAADNTRHRVIGGSGSLEDESMSLYYPHRWVTDSGNNEDGSGTFGRHAQRKSVIQSLQAMVNGNQDIRDEESRQFNLMATPGYPELIGEMVTLNYDRRLTAFVVGDTPARLTPDATSLNEWATNVNLAVEDNDDGAVSRDEYLGMYYPWGFSSDNAGNNIVVPPSHMALRTMVLNDQVAFPWFAPAGTRRGGVTNATSSGYINSEGEFVSVALNTGQRDTLYSNSINPITFISGAGLVVFGQKTRARNASALDRVNVARLVVYLRGQLELLARPYLFEPNDKITRDQVKAAADALLLELVGLRALYDFLVVCDESNNTPARIDRNELWLDIAIEPVKAIEFIYIPLRIKNTGEIAALG
tara:strand:+ start:5170 stop:8493 length:3324 start_codon:yes stop_codon:yes gene_type:complete